ncbi:MAG TPA: SUMF1/EgtB/PvdO family nonheme iron enzyme [Bryobacteraceae bacterium]|nr:SUMF1/EgtB/PvdO family nonheme iron enzyme [Bryobacteraceae bacterium]
MSTAPLMSRALAARMASARRRTDELFALLTPDAYYARPVPERHRLIFYLGHLEAFDWNQIARNALHLPSFDPQFDKLFEFGIDPPMGRSAQDRPSDWPSVAQVLTYNRRVRRIIDELLEHAPDQIAQVAIEHRLMHAETFAYLLHNLPYEQKLSTGRNPPRGARSVAPVLIPIPGGQVTLGQKPEEFGWDNEFQEHRVAVPAFAIAKHKVTNGEYLEFVKEGAPLPHFWIQRAGECFYRGMFAEVPLPLDTPVYVTHQEATRYAHWKNQALPSEEQFHRAAYGTPSGVERDYPWGQERPDSTRGNFDFLHWDPSDVASTPAGDSAFGVSQLVGNGWEWTSTRFGPFPGFEPFPFYPGYSKNFFDEQHYVLKGASPRTDACFLRRSFRNWFRPDYPYVYASFRLVEN